MGSSSVFFLNYVPIIGPVFGLGMFLIAGIVALEWPWSAFLPAGLYLLIHIAEGGIITPLLLAKRVTLNPVVVIVPYFSGTHSGACRELYLPFRSWLCS